MLFIIATQHKKQSDKELLGSIIKNEDDDELRLGEVIKNTKKAGKVIKELLNLFKELDDFLRIWV